jgi:hypothetical protein
MTINGEGFYLKGDVEVREEPPPVLHTFSEFSDPLAVHKI